MKKVITIMAAALVALPLLAANVEVKYSGPSGQGDVIWYAPSTETTNLTMTTTGLKNVKLQSGTLTTNVVKQTGAVTAEGTNNLVTPTIIVTIETTLGYDSTGAAVSNAAGDSVLFMTNATATCSPDLASNAVVVVNVTGGGAVVTNIVVQSP